jgi:DNA-binding transcriptional MocR family regulator
VRRSSTPAELRPVSAYDQRVYRAIAAYAFDESEAWPSQERVADDLGICREQVNRAVRRLEEAGWLEITERRRGRKGWWHNVYALLAPFVSFAAQRITKRAHSRTAPISVSPAENSPPPRREKCTCWACKPPPRGRPNDRAPRPEPRTPLQALRLKLYRQDVAAGIPPTMAVAMARAARAS